MSDILTGWKETNGWNLPELMKIVTSLSDQESCRLRDIIREYGIRSPVELLFIPQA
jgi:hypothetical protein